ncbi:hypothetical protein VKT23_004507 [Stygiomarasmius scandens]|uniref:Uncharacterized protein n=1 Tax=Marasmiellus scandens TaxID=2682957 RepID=A0ABR1JV75_9AGAR
MAKAPSKSILIKRNSGPRPSRSTAPVSFVDDRVDSDDEIQNDDGENEEGQSEGEDMDVGKLLQEIQKRQAKKTSLVSAAFENQKKALFANARQKTKDMSRDGIVYLENIKPSILVMRENEISYERHLEQIRALMDAQDVWTVYLPRSALSDIPQAAVENLFQLYPPIIDGLFVKRSDVIEEESQMLKNNPTRRQKALNQSLQNAHDQVEQSHQSKMAATDASKLIKHYKALLLS